MQTVMIIPAKGFSRRIPRKNMKSFCGVPLVGWSVIQGMAAKSVRDVYVTTDDHAIGAYAEGLGARVIYRRYQDTNATSGSVPVKEAITRLLNEGTIELTTPLITRLCTTPTLLPHDLDGMVDLYWHNIEKYGVNGLSCGAPCRTHIVSRQVVPGVSVSIPEATCHNDNSIVHHLSFASVQLASTMLGHKDPDVDPNAKPFRGCYFYSFQEWQMQDCDTEEEWEFAEVVAEHYILKGRTVEEVYYGDN